MEKVQEEKPEENGLLTVCPSCKNTFSKRAGACPHCHADRVSECQVCKSSIPASSSACPNCGDPKPFGEEKDVSFSGQDDSGAGPNIKETPVILTIIFTLITAGIYLPCWFLTRLDALNSLESKEKLGRGLFVIMIVLYGLSIILNMTAGVLEGMAERTESAELMDLAAGISSVDGVMSLAVTIIMILQCFKVRRIFQGHFNDHLRRNIPFSALATFFLGIFYLQYKINRFED